jgi:hypothetical protein
LEALELFFAAGFSGPADDLESVLELESEELPPPSDGLESLAADFL